MTEKAVGCALEDALALEGEGETFSTTLSDAWEIWGPSGGYLAALALRAAGLRAEIAKPASFYCQFLRSPAFARVELAVGFLKRSRRSEALTVSMAQEGRPVLHASVRTATEAPGYEHQHLRLTDVPGPDSLRSTEELWSAEQRPPFRFWQNVERRPLDQRYTPADGGRDEAAPVVREWVRFRPVARFHDRFIDAARSLILLDTYGWPAAFRRHGAGEFVAPNLDTAAWFHQPTSSSEWLMIDHECVVADGGLLGVSGKVWDLDGRLVASGGAQLVCIPA